MGRVYSKRATYDIWGPEAGKPSLVDLRKKVFIGLGSLIAAFFIFALSFVPKESILAGGLANSAWPKYGHDERNTARQQGFFTQTGDFDLSWTLDLAPHDPGVTFLGNSVLGSDGTIYIGGYAASAPVYAIDPTGLLRWHVALGDGSRGGIDATIALDQSGDLFIPTPYGFFKLHQNDGSVVWSNPSLLTDGSSPTIAANGTIYTYGTGAGMPGAAFFALNPDGTILWSIDLTAPSRGAPAIALDGTIYFSTQDGKLWALNSDGSIKWQYGIGSSTISVLVGIDGTVYVAASLKLSAVNPDGTLKWAYDASGSYIGNGLAEGEDGTIYFGVVGPPHSVFAINTNGTLKWQYETTSGIDGGVSVDGQGTIYAPANVSVYALSPDGSKHWQYDRPPEFDLSFYSTPVISADSVLLIVSSADNGTVTALIPRGLRWGRSTTLLSKPPKVTIEKPQAGDFLSANTRITYTAYDPDGTTELGFSDKPISIDYSIDEGIVGTWRSIVYNGPNSSRAEFDTTSLPDGTQVFIRIVARDRTQLFDEKTAGPFLVDNQKPTFLVHALSVKNPGFFNIPVEASEALKDIGIYVNQAGRGRVLAPTADSGDHKHFTARYEIVPGFDGVAKVEVNGTDLAGNVSDTIIAGDRFSVFVTPPRMPTVLAPRDGDIFAEPLLALSGTSVPSARVIVTVNGTERYETKPLSDGTFSVTSVRLSTKNRGKNTVAVVAEDAIGVSEPFILNVIVNTLPKVTILSPRAGRTLSDAVKFSWSAEDPNADRLRFSFAYSTDDGVTWITTATGTAGTAYIWDSTLAPDGPGTKVRIAASDGIGESYAIGGPYTLKNDLPVIILESPASLFINSHSLSLKGHIRSELYGILGLAYSFNRTDWTAIPAQDGSYNTLDEPFSLLLPQQFSDGTITLYLRAQDSRRKFGYREMAFTIDTLPPQKPSLRQDRTPLLYGDADDADRAKDGLQVVLQGGAESLSDVSVFSGGKEIGKGTADKEGIFSVSVTVPGHGVNELQAVSQDRAGNRSVPGSFMLIADNAPLLSLNFPGKNDFIGERHTLSWHAQDRDNDTVGDFGLSVRSPKAKDSAERAWNIFARGVKGTSYAWEGVSKFPSGDYELRFSGSDGYVVSELTAPIHIDSASPSLEAALTIPRRTKDPRIAGQGSAYDDFSGIEAVEFSLNGEPFTKATLTHGYRTATSTYRFSFPKELPDGTYTLKLRATDRAENTSQIASTLFTVDTTPPHVGALRIQQGPTQLFPKEGVVEMFGGAPYGFSLALSDDAVESTFLIHNTPFSLTRSSGGQLFEGRIELADTGVYPMRVEVKDDLGNGKTAEVGKVRIIEPARVVDAGTMQPLAGARVSAYFFDGDAKVWRLWDGAAYGEQNPQTTQKNGAFRYFLPQGTYELRLGAPGYRRTKTSQITISNSTFLTVIVPLKKAGLWERVLQLFSSY